MHFDFLLKSVFGWGTKKKMVHLYYSMRRDPTTKAGHSTFQSLCCTSTKHTHTLERGVHFPGLSTLLELQSRFGDNPVKF